MFAPDPSAITEAVARHMARTPHPRNTSTPATVSLDPRALVPDNLAGAQHARLCMVCAPRGAKVILTKCRCVERCSWPHCTKTIIRTDPVLYSEGVTRAPVPRFKEN